MKKILIGAGIALIATSAMAEKQNNNGFGIEIGKITISSHDRTSNQNQFFIKSDSAQYVRLFHRTELGNNFPNLDIGLLKSGDLTYDGTIKNGPYKGLNSKINYDLTGVDLIFSYAKDSIRPEVGLHYYKTKADSVKNVKGIGFLMGLKWDINQNISLGARFLSDVAGELDKVNQLNISYKF